jgi:Patatin-like phospholipase
MHSPNTSSGDKALNFEQVFKEEITVVESSRMNRKLPPGNLPHDLVGLSFSGGGIRSATFNLGVLQALAKKNLLRYADYLSTVSGGGYIGSWLTSWAYHLAKNAPNVNHIAQIEKALNCTAEELGDRSEAKQIQFLRQYSNYLTPRLGILSGDTLAFVGTYLRNLLLNQVILISALMALLLVPRGLGLVFWKFHGPRSALVCAIVSIALLGAVCVQVLLNMGPSKGYSPPAVVQRIAVPLFLFCVTMAYLLWQLVLEGDTQQLVSPDTRLTIVVLSTVSYAALWLLGTPFIAATRSPNKWASAMWALPAGFTAGLLIDLAIPLLIRWTTTDGYTDGWPCLITYGVPLAAATTLLVGVVHLGLIGRSYADGLREWWARLGGTVMAIAAGWFLVSVATLFVPRWLGMLVTFLQSPTDSWVMRVWKALSALGVTGLFGGWATATFKGLSAARGPQTGPRPETGPDADIKPLANAHLLARLAPPIFAAGLIFILAVILYHVLPMASANPAENAKWYQVVLVALVLYGISRFFGYRVDVNEFSLHNAYRNRLIRCYLGATNARRDAQKFTGFDESDNICMHWLLKLAAPFHILNATLNVVKGRELALQARKARSFVFTPLYSGFEYAGNGETANSACRAGYRLSSFYAHNSPNPGARLGTAMAISGAAASPNMGHYTNGAVSFLLTVFSVRLGWWVGNPRFAKCWESGRPRSSWKAIMNELTGNTNDEAKQVYLSDGGHFENLGLYELVRRRCNVIIACDAGADSHCLCNDLASAIEKCRVDFGTTITINLDAIRPTKQLVPGDARLRVSERAFTAGTVYYPDGTEGKLVYIKPSLNSDLPQDVLAYARLAEAFPHQSTMDQFFDEAQFESYRALGYACGTEAIEEIEEAIGNRCAEPVELRVGEELPKVTLEVAQNGMVLS